MSNVRGAAIVIASAARATARCAAMTAANQARADQGYAQAYGEEAFLAVIEEEAIGWNSVIAMLEGDA